MRGDQTPLEKTTAAKVNIFLTDNAPNRYCDECLAAEVGMKEVAEVRTIAQALATTNVFWRDSGHCDECDEEAKTTESNA